jgi:hypothetical protein
MSLGNVESMMVAQDLLSYPHGLNTLRFNVDEIVLGPEARRTHDMPSLVKDTMKNSCRFISPCCIFPAPVAAPRERTMTMSVHKRGTKWYDAFCIRGVRYRGAIPEASSKFDAEKPKQKFAKMFMKAATADQPETRISKSSSKRSTSLGRWRSGHSRVTTNINSRSSVRANVFKGKTFAQISPLLIEK